MRTSFSLSCLEKENYDGEAVCVEPNVGLGGVTNNGTAFLVPTGTRLSERKQVFKSDGKYKFTSSKFSFDREFVLLGTSHGAVLRAEFNGGGHRMLFKISEAEKKRASGEAIAFLAISKQHDMIAAATKRWVFVLSDPSPNECTETEVIMEPLPSDIISLEWVPIASKNNATSKNKLAIALTSENAYLLSIEDNAKSIKCSLIEACKTKTAFTRASFSPDGQILALVCTDSHLHCYRIKVGASSDVNITAFATFDTYESPVNCVAWDSTSRLLATSDGGDCTVWKMDCRSEERSKTEIQESKSIMCCGPELSSPIVSMSFQPNGFLLATVTLSGKVAVYDSRTFRCGGLASPVGAGLLLEEEPEAMPQLCWESQHTLLALVPGSYLVRLQCKNRDNDHGELEGAKEEVSCPITPSNGTGTRSPERSSDLSREIAASEAKKQSKGQVLKSGETPYPRPIRTSKASSPIGEVYHHPPPPPPPPPLSPPAPVHPSLVAHIHHLRYSPSSSQGRAVQQEPLTGWGIGHGGHGGYAAHAGHPSSPWMGTAVQPSPFAFHMMPPMVAMTPQHVMGGRPTPPVAGNDYYWPVQNPSVPPSWVPVGMATHQQQQQQQPQYSLQQWAGIAPGYMNYQQGGAMASSPADYYPGPSMSMSSSTSGGSGGMYPPDDPRWPRHRAQGMPMPMPMIAHSHRETQMQMQMQMQMPMPMPVPVPVSASSPSSSARTSSGPLGASSLMDGSTTSAVHVLSPQGSREVGMGSDTPRSDVDARSGAGVGVGVDISPSEAGALTVYVGNLLPSVDENVLMWTFAQFGPVTHVQVIRDRGTQASRGYGFVTYAHSAYATLAMQQLHGRVLFGAFGGQRIKVAPTNKSDSDS